jgi:hypothetical protein
LPYLQTDFCNIMSVSPISSSISGFTPSPRRLDERSAAQANPGAGAANQRGDAEQSKGKTETSTSTSTSTSASSTRVELSDEALAQIAKLKARDLEVRQHEAAHLAAAGALATGGPSFTFQKGPDGVNYAIGGEVGIDVSPGRTPEETIAKARTIQAAALAPAEPSGPDLAVAAQGQQLEQQARTELAIQSAKEAEPEQNPAQEGAQNSAQNSPQNSVQNSLQEERRNNLNRLYGLAQSGSGSLSVFA